MQETEARRQNYMMNIEHPTSNIESKEKTNQYDREGTHRKSKWKGLWVVYARSSLVTGHW